MRKGSAASISSSAAVSSSRRAIVMLSMGDQGTGLKFASPSGRDATWQKHNSRAATHAVALPQRGYVRCRQTREGNLSRLAGYFLQAHDLIGLGPLCALNDVEFDLIAFLEALVAFALYGTVMNKDIGAIVPTEEAVSLCIVEPFDGAFVLCQDPYSLFVHFRRSLPRGRRGGEPNRL